MVKNIIDLRRPPSSKASADAKALADKSEGQRKEPETAQEISGEIRPGQQVVHKSAAIAIAISFVFIGLAYIFFENNILTAVFFFLVSLVILIFAFKEKQTVLWEITRHGVTVERSFYPFRDLKSFWIEYQPGQIKEISLKSKKWYRGFVKIPLNQEDPLKIREFLLDFLLEERHEDNLVETITRHLGI
ncbi:MAG: Uncharacterized protein G01um101444_492 [Parcubacteria group bacterium Gr01-1014_44]|nr:MAG: Uncharacterized protein G01um101444_492 [Parcubacteria group bacterium Gr01-1014_44]